MAPAAAAPGIALALLAADRVALPVRLGGVIPGDGTRYGAIATRVAPGSYRRVEPGPIGPLLLEAREDAGGVVLEVWGPEATPADAAGPALLAARAWAGLDDRPERALDVLRAHSLTLALLRQTGPFRLSRLPRVGEAFGKAVLGQLVQGRESRRSIAQVAGRFGTATGHGLWAWPTAAQLGAVPAWELRRCGVSLKWAQALHAGALRDGTWEAIAREGDWGTLDVRLRALPGVGLWTSAETRIALGDADAVSVGDYHMPHLVTYLLGEGARGAGRPRAEYTDEEMLAHLAPFAPHRGRVIRMLEAAAARGLVAAPPRRAPRAALSAHRYW